MTRQFTLGKKERLKSRKKIEQLFKEGKSFSVFPFRVYYLLEGTSQPGKDGSPVQFGVGVSSRNFKKAVDRNRIKRLTKESFRLQKPGLMTVIQEKSHRLDLFFIFTGKELPDFDLVKEKTAVALSKLGKIIHEDPSPHT